MLVNVTESQEFSNLLKWSQETPGLHSFHVDYHRLQLEHWIWAHREELGHHILDIGVEIQRNWLGTGYVSFGRNGDEERVHGDLLALPFADATFDGVVLTEVLEHCVNPPLAVSEVHRVLKPGGLLLATSPFFWPWHGTREYEDYWRFTFQGWKLMLRDFHDVKIIPCAWTKEGEQLYSFLRRFEGWGFACYVHAHTAYLCEARR